MLPLAVRPLCFGEAPQRIEIKVESVQAYASTYVPIWSDHWLLYGQEQRLVFHLLSDDDDELQVPLYLSTRLQILRRSCSPCIFLFLFLFSYRALTHKRQAI